MSDRFVFGPVHSRRLGYSLGVDPVPRKLCSMDCIYCEVGPTDLWTMERREWIPRQEILEEIRRKLAGPERIDVITFSGSGEPVLHAGLGEMIDAVHAMTDRPVCLLTNGSWLHEPAVRAEIARADIVAPSLDAVTPEVFEAINKPHPRLKVADVIEGLIALRQEYEGQIWLEILFVTGINDDDEEVSRLAEVIGRIRPDRVHLNTVVRPPAYSGVQSVSWERMCQIRTLIGEPARIVTAPPVEERRAASGDLAAEIETVACRRPVTREDLADVLGRPIDELEPIIMSLLQRERLQEHTFDGHLYLEGPR